MGPHGALLRLSDRAVDVDGPGGRLSQTSRARAEGSGEPGGPGYAAGDLWRVYAEGFCSVDVMYCYTVSTEQQLAQ